MPHETGYLIHDRPPNSITQTPKTVPRTPDPKKLNDCLNQAETNYTNDVGKGLFEFSKQNISPSSKFIHGFFSGFNSAGPKWASPLAWAGRAYLATNGVPGGWLLTSPVAIGKAIPGIAEGFNRMNDNSYVQTEIANRESAYENYRQNKKGCYEQFGP